MTDRFDPLGAGAPVEAVDDPQIARLVWQFAGIGIALMAAGAGLLWWHFGPVIFFDTLATLQSCF